jgi:hypothetical protein
MLHTLLTVDAAAKAPDTHPQNTGACVGRRFDPYTAMPSEVRPGSAGAIMTSLGFSVSIQASAADAS